MEALEQMPQYAKFMKDLLTKKRRFRDEETFELEAGCNAIIQKPLPRKSKNPGSFTIPISIGEIYLGKIEVKLTRITLQLADRSIKYLYGVAEDVLVKVDSFFFLVDFVVMDIKEDTKAPLILGRQFMKSVKVVIDVEHGTLKIEAQDEEVKFEVFPSTQQPNITTHCMRVDIVKELPPTLAEPIPKLNTQQELQLNIV
ncbi:uncharacterized protein LOC113862223 [Abrus precatorius]|uniref:Uncharacterized protein LOC113862223 n=1 Tax=Abrus precatorius TaxID=3816 RepID=A0A8B8L4J1_ABRPR|nr:uncharacterized protein LOC113862223 [Abrus precatorius]